MRIDEISRKDIMIDVDQWTKDKAKKIRGVTYLGITEDYTVFFRVNSVTAKPPTTYLVKIKLVDYPDVADNDDLSVQEKVRLAIAGDLQVSCTCPAYLYWGYKYILTQLDTNEADPENRFPKIRNPKLQGVVCKHCYIALQAFPFNWNTIARDIKQEKFLRSDR